VSAPAGAAPAPFAIEADGLRKHYALRRGFLGPRQTIRALDGVSFRLAPGRTIAVVGESGCGKTTLARQLTLIERPTAGRLGIDGEDAGTADRQVLRRLRRRVQMVFQNPYSSLNPRKTVAAIVEEPLAINTHLAAAERRARAVAMLERVGLRAEHAGRYPHMFSGGQRQRIAIARAMVLDPAVVVADEPVSALDVSVQAQVLNLFMDLQEGLGTAYVFVSHNLAVVEHVAHEVLVMYLGRVVEFGATRRLFDAPRHPYTRALLSASPSFDASRRDARIAIRGELPSPASPPSGCPFHPRCPAAGDRCRTEPPELRDLDGRQVACHFADAGADAAGDSVRPLRRA
jgi:dipeptide transport system ATP-binding protein